RCPPGGFAMRFTDGSVVLSRLAVGGVAVRAVGPLLRGATLPGARRAQVYDHRMVWYAALARLRVAGAVRATVVLCGSASRRRVAGCAFGPRHVRRLPAGRGSGVDRLPAGALVICICHELEPPRGVGIKVAQGPTVG